MAEEKFKFGNYLYEHGYSMISNLLVDYQEELGLDNDEVVFIIKVYRHKNGYKLHDSNLDSTLSTKTLQRRRKSLVEKGYLQYTVHKSNDSSGNIITDGIVYDLTALDIALAQLSADIIEKREEENKFKKVEVKKKDTSKIKKEDVIEFFKEEFKNRYNKDYIISNEEKERIKRMSPAELSAVKNIFDYCDENKENLPENFMPRIIFFTKLQWRMDKLLEFSSDRESSAIEEEKIKVEIEANRLAEERYLSLTGDDDKDFTYYLRKEKPSIFLKKKNGMMLNIIDELEVVYKEYKGELNAKQTK